MIAVLFARADSVYKDMAGLDVWDAQRDARRWPGGCPVIAHPPCRAWGRLRHMAKPRHDEKPLALFAVDMVRKFGGILEHPSASTLWPTAGLPPAGERDSFGGWTLPISQYWWGHRAEKRTWLYIVGIEPAQLPPMPLVLGEAPCIIGTSGRDSHGNRSKRRPETTKAEREHTPPQFARWLAEAVALVSAPGGTR